jgi:hypothetical protein
MDDNCIRQNAEVLEGSYFNAMYGWYRWEDSERSWSDYQYKTVTKTEVKTMTSDDHFDARKDNSSMGKRYHVHLGHMYDMTQEGYHERTKYNRVCCVRKMPNNYNN